MENPELIPGYDTSDTNLTAISSSRQLNGYAFKEALPSGELNTFLQQLFNATNKNKNDGVWDWADPTVPTNNTEYNTGSVVTHSGDLYLSLIDTNEVTPGTDETKWKKINNFVDLVSAQTIAGIKTFSSSPIVPTATAENQVVNLATANSYDLGVGQTLQDLTASRSAGVTYTNTTGKPIYISVTSSNTIDGTVDLFLNGVRVNRSNYDGSSSEQLYCTLIVPNGFTYSATISGANVTSWYELR